MAVSQTGRAYKFMHILNTTPRAGLYPVYLRNPVPGVAKNQFIR